MNELTQSRIETLTARLRVATELSDIRKITEALAALQPRRHPRRFRVDDELMWNSGAGAIPVSYRGKVSDSAAVIVTSDNRQLEVPLASLEWPVDVSDDNA